MNKWMITTLVTLLLLVASLLAIYKQTSQCGDKSTLIYQGQVYCVDVDRDTETPPDVFKFYIPIPEYHSL